MSSYFTTGNSITVAAEEPRKGFGGKLEPLNDKTLVAVTFPNAELDPVTVYRPFASLDVAKAAAKDVAGQINKIAPRGFTTRLSTFRGTDLADREKIETLVREWGGSNAIVDED